MRRFHFRLERLLELRAYKEREWQAKLAEKTGICLKLAGRIREVEKETERSFRQRFASPGGLSIEVLQAWELYLNRLAAERSKLEGELAEKRRERDEVQKRYIEVSRDKKVLEKLKERRQDEYYTEQRLEEFKVLDEIGMSQTARKRRR